MVTGLVSSLEDLEYFRTEMQRTLVELADVPPDDFEVREAILSNGLAGSVARALVSDLRTIGYTGRLDTLSDCCQAVAWYEASKLVSFEGQFLADALFLAKAFTDPYYPGHSETLLLRLCYRLSGLFGSGFAETVRAGFAQRAEARSRGGKKGAETRRAENADRDRAICDLGRRLISEGRAAHNLAGIISENATAEGLSPKQIRTILRTAGVVPVSSKKGK